MRRIALILSAVATLAGCGFDSGPDVQHPGTQGAGRILINWTIGGQPPSTTSCAGIDHLRLRVETYSDAVIISPVPCTNDRVRFDNLPEGTGIVRLTAVDANDCAVARGEAPITVTTTLPASPSPTVAISAVQPCP